MINLWELLYYFYLYEYLNFPKIKHVWGFLYTREKSQQERQMYERIEGHWNKLVHSLENNPKNYVKAIITTMNSKRINMKL